MNVLCFYFSKDAPLQELAEIFYNYTPQISIRENRALFLETDQCSSIYSREGILKRCLVHLSHFDLRASYAMASDAPSSLAMAIYKTPKESLPIEALQFYASPFKFNNGLEKHVSNFVLFLIKLGIRTISDFQKIDPHRLTPRFGALGSTLSQLTHDASSILWPRFSISEKISETIKYDFEHPEDSIEPLLFHLKSMIERIHFRSKSRGLRIKTFHIDLTLEHRSSNGSSLWNMPVTLSNGYISPKSIFNLTRERFQNEVCRRPLPHRVSEMRIEVIETSPYLENQRDLFDPKREESDESYVSLLSRLRLRLGSNSVFLASPQQSFIPEFNWKKVESHSELDHKNDISSLPRRPLRIFKNPIPTRVDEGRIQWNNIAVHFHNTKDKEVVMSEWWNGVTERVYFRAEAHPGVDLWLFRNKDGVFIHGYFD